MLLLLTFFGFSVSFGQETGEVKVIDKMDKIEESVLVNTTQKTELVNRKEGKKEISTKTSAGIVNRDASVSYWPFFFFSAPSNRPSLCYKQPKSLI